MAVNEFPITATLFSVEFALPIWRAEFAYPENALLENVRLLPLMVCIAELEPLPVRLFLETTPFRALSLSFSPSRLGNLFLKSFPMIENPLTFPRI